MSETMSGQSRDGKSTRLRVLGVDPAAAGPTGYGIIESDGRQCRTLHYGALGNTARQRKESQGRALKEVHALLSRLMEEYAPDVVAVESIFAALNVRTALRLAEVRGVVLLAAEQHGLPVHSYAPREVKASIAGYGHADKRQVQLMVRTLLSMTETPEPADAADALAVALCHLQVEQATRRFRLPQERTTTKSATSMARSGATSGAARAGTTRLSAPRIVYS